MGALISLLHATRGRAKQAWDCRANWLCSAWDRDKVEHIFAVDEDDQESLHMVRPLVLGRDYIIVPAGGGCVRAWNAAAAASMGSVLVQLSDDWFPPLGWDKDVVWALQDLTRSAVLWISDGHRKDKLLCMAILTRARWEEQGRELFSPEYKSLYSDTEFSFRAFRDGVVIDARQIEIDHRHPFWGKAAWDQTYEQSSGAERDREGREIFKRRNPDANLT